MVQPVGQGNQNWQVATTTRTTIFQCSLCQIITRVCNTLFGSSEINTQPEIIITTRDVTVVAPLQEQHQNR